MRSARIIALLLTLIAVVGVPTVPATADSALEEGAGTATGSFYYSSGGLPGPDPVATSWSSYVSGTGTFSTGSVPFAGAFSLYLYGYSSAETTLAGSGTVSFNLYGSGTSSLWGWGSGTYVRTATNLRLNLEGTSSWCDSNDCYSTEVTVAIFAEVRDWFAGCSYGSCSLRGIYHTKLQSENSPPAIPALLSPLEEETIGAQDLQRFSIKTTDDDDDLYTGYVTVRDSSGSVISFFETAPSASGEESVGQPISPLPKGDYTWTAKAADQWGAVGSESSARNLSVSPAPGSAESGPTFRVSTDTSGDEAQGASFWSRVSGDGRYVAFTSSAPDLVPNDTNTCPYGYYSQGTCPDVFVRDRATGNTTRVSLSSDGSQANGQSFGLDISRDGRYIVFRSDATNLVPGDTNDATDIFVHDRATETTIRASVSSSGSQGNHWGSDDASISDDGRYVAFRSWSSNLVSNDTNYEVDIFVRDLVAGTTSRVSVSSSGQQGDFGFSCCTAVSGDGRYVIFASQFNNLVAGDTNYAYDVFVHDRNNASTTRVSVDSFGRQADDWSLSPSVSSDGRYIAFASWATNLVAGDTNTCNWDPTPGACPDVFVHDRVISKTTRASLSDTGQQGNDDSYVWIPDISDDGRLVTFVSEATNLVGDDTNAYSDAFVRDRAAGGTARVSVDSEGNEANGPTNSSSISGDGSQVSLDSLASNLVGEDTNSSEDVFRYELAAPPEVCDGTEVIIVGCVGGNEPNSDMMGLEEFYPFHSLPLGGNGTAQVNLATGNLITQFSDFDIPGQGLGLQLIRTYNAHRDDLGGPLGKGWSLGIAEGSDPTLGGLVSALTSLDLSQAVMILGTEDQFDFYDADGTRHHFVKGGLAGPGWHSPPGVNLVLSDSVDSVGKRWYKLTRPDGVRYEFRLLGLDYRLTKIADRNGNTLDFAYSFDGLLQSITDIKARTLTFTWSGLYLSRVRFQSGSEVLDVTYTVDPGSGRLTSATEAAGTSSARTTSYLYTAGVGLSRVTDPRGGQTNFYGSGRLDRVADRGGKNWYLTYEGDACQPLAGFMSTATCLTDPEGFKWVWTISQEGNLIHHRDPGDVDENGTPRQNDQQYVWVENRLRRYTDPLGNVTEYEYNELGLTTETRFTGVGDPPVISKMSYERVGLATADLKQIRTAVGSSEERVWAYSHDSAGNVTSSTDPGGQTSTNTYYVRGLPKTDTDPMGNTMIYGNAALSDGGYHASGQAPRLTDQTGATESFSFDFLGNQTQRTDQEGKVWRTESDLRGNRTKVIDPLGNDTWYCFDPNDNEILTVLPKQPSPSCSLTESSAHVTRYTYDPRDLRTSQVSKSDTQLRKTTYSYSPDGLLTETLNPRSFDSSGNLLADSSKHQRTVNTYYPNNRLKATTNETGAKTDYTYTPSGQPSQITEPSNGTSRASTSYQYDGRGQVKIEQRSGDDKPTLYGYNLNGELTSVTDPNGYTTSFGYDDLGRLVRMIDPMGNTTTREYDANGNLSAIRQPTGAGEYLTTTYSYTPRGEIATVSDPADSSHQIEYIYDAVGRQRSRKDRYSGDVERTFEQVFTDNGLLARRIATAPGLATHDTSFGYDYNGNLTAFTNSLGGSPLSSVSATYTTADELKTWTETISSITKSSSYTYLQDGSLQTRTTDGKTTTYDYEVQSGDSEITPWGGSGNFTSEFFPSGHRKKVTFPNGVSQEEAYDLGGRLLSRVLTSVDGSKPSSWEAITYDGNDNRISELVTQVPANSALLPRVGTSQYVYDPAGRLVSASHPFAPTPAAFVLDSAANIVSDGKGAYSYQANRLQRRDALPADGATNYSYDHLGNLSSETNGSSTTSITYDAASHTRRVTLPGGNWVQYSYDGFDRAVKRETSLGETTLFFHDGESQSLSLETTDAGVVQTRYVHDPLGAPLAQDRSGAPSRSYFVTDPKGNLTQLLDQTAAVVATFAYDAFGKELPSLTETSSSWDSRLRYQMSPRDPLTGRYLLGRRLYDPTTTRFSGIDEAVGAGGGMELQSHPLTANRYLYAGANPVSFGDNGNHPTSTQARTQTWGLYNPFGLSDRFRLGIFIKECNVGFLFAKLRGDCRGFDFNFDPARTRAAFAFDFGGGKASVRINPTCDAGGHCHGARRIGWVPHLNNHVIYWQSSSGRLILSWWSLVQSRYPPAPLRIDGILSLYYRGGGYFYWSILHDAYPSYELYWSRGSLRQTLYRFSERGPWALCGLRFTVYRYAC